MIRTRALRLIAACLLPVWLAAAAAAQDLPCFVLIRPREGDFCYTRREIDVIRRDIDTVRSLKLAGVVIGASRPDGTLDRELRLPISQPTMPAFGGPGSVAASAGSGTGSEA